MSQRLLDLGPLPTFWFSQGSRLLPGKTGKLSFLSTLLFLEMFRCVRGLCAFSKLKFK